jgi:hypothetical protein
MSDERGTKGRPGGMAAPTAVAGALRPATVARRGARVCAASA